MKPNITYKKIRGHFGHLLCLYEADELTGAINRIIEDMNHRFLLSVLIRDFKSHDFGSAAQMERKRAALAGKVSILDRIDAKTVTERLMDILKIRNQADQHVRITEAHVQEIKAYLKLLELIVDIPAEGIGIQSTTENVIFTQPGMRYCQAQALVYILMKDPLFKEISAADRKMMTDRILEDVKGRLLEEIILLETAKVLPKHKHAFKLFFPVGEFDMVIADTENVTCEIFEIKHSNQVHPDQIKHLTDADKCHQTAFEYGEITGKTVLYRGKDQMVNGIRYRNVEKFLEELSVRSYA